MSTLSDPEAGSGPASLLARLSGALAAAERLVARAMVIGFVGLITANVGMRYLGGRPIVFAEELAAILIVWLAFVAISISIHDRTQIGVTILTDVAGARTQRRVDRIVHLIIAAILAVLLWKSVGWVRSPVVAFEQVITTGWPKWPFFLIVPIFCVTGLVHVLAHIVRPTGEHHEVTL
jgi:TRAP-type transport system small permease protein